MEPVRVRPEAVEAVEGALLSCTSLTALTLVDGDGM